MSTDTYRVVPEKLRKRCNAESLPFSSTAELSELEEMIGQERAVRSIRFGVEMDGDGYNIFATGPSGVGRNTAVESMVRSEAEKQPTQDDWLYVYNFQEPRNPRYIKMPAGRGQKFSKDMNQLIKEIRQAISQALESDMFESKKKEIMQNMQNKRNKMLQELEQEARERSFTIQKTSGGFAVVPLLKGQPIDPDKFNNLPPEKQEELEDGRQEMQERVSEVIEQIQKMEREAKEELERVRNDIVENAIQHLFEELKEKYREYPRICKYLEEVHEDIIDNIELFESDNNNGNSPKPPFIRAHGQKDFESVAYKYAVNVIVDNKNVEGAPVVMESNPTYRNLFGRIERQVQMGALVTNFTMIEAGALHRANGGYLICEARHLLRNPLVWEGLKRTIKEEEIRIADLMEEYGLVNTVNLDPEPIPADIKVILIGNRQLFELLYNLDEEFSELFKVRADFTVEMDYTDENLQNYGLFVHDYCEDKGLTHLDSTGMARLIEYSSELVSDQRKLSTRFSLICEILEEANYWCSQRDGEKITSEDIEQALQEKEYRSNLAEEKIQDMLEDETIIIDVTGKEVGQVNGLAVTQTGNYSFGRPSRITARTYAGREGLVNVEREVDLSGKIHDKGVMILSGYISGKYGQDKPLSLSASLTFEQQYGMIEGDSASCAEVFALLSSLSELPLRQDIAVTGSVNQKGVVQPVGGIKEKIEGFYTTCKTKGLTGDQGVIIPRKNLKNLMLDPEVVAAVEDDAFSVYAIEEVAEGMEILTDRTMGEADEEGNYPEGSINARVDKKLQHYCKIWQSRNDDS